MNLQLNEREIETLKKALVKWSIRVQDAQKNIPVKSVWDLYEEEIDITEKIIKKIKENENSDQCQNR